MFQKYREIFRGGIIGLGAAALDTFIDAQTQENSFVDQITQHPTVMLYRAIFLGFGLAIGFLIWRNRRRERDFQRIFLAAERLQQRSDDLVHVPCPPRSCFYGRNWPLSHLINLSPLCSG